MSPVSPKLKQKGERSKSSKSQSSAYIKWLTGIYALCSSFVGAREFAYVVKLFFDQPMKKP